MLNDDFFAGLNQPLTEDQKQIVAQSVYGQLEDRVGEQLQAKLSDQQFEEFEKVIENGDDNELAAWLSQNASGYEQLVNDTLEQLKQEAKADLTKFLK